MGRRQDPTGAGSPLRVRAAARESPGRPVLIHSTPEQTGLREEAGGTDDRL